MSNPGAFQQVAEVYRSSRKERDIFWNIYVARPLAAVVVHILRKTPMTPNQVTFLGFGVFLASMVVLVAWPGWHGFLAAAAVLEGSYLLDCADGQLARIKGMTSDVGAYLDFFIDEVKALLLVAAMAANRWVVLGDDRWLLVGIGGVVLVAAGTSLTTFIRRPEYAGTAVKPGLPVVQAAPAGLIPKVRWIVERFLRWIVHYPSWFIYIALLDGLDGVDGVMAFLVLYLGTYLLYVGRTSLAVLLRLGRPSFYSEGA